MERLMMNWPSLAQRLAALERDGVLTALRSEAAATTSEPALRRLGAVWRGAVLRALFAPGRSHRIARIDTSGRKPGCRFG